MRDQSVRLLNKVIDELSCAQNHLRTAVEQCDSGLNNEEIHQSLRCVCSALDSAQSTLINRK